MIRHIVMWSLRQGDDAPRFKALLDSCRAIVPGILEFEVAVRAEGLDANVDVVLVSTFANQQALDAYQQHPTHQAVLAQLGPMRQTRHVLDYRTPQEAA